MSELAKSIIEAAKRRIRRGSVKVGDKVFAVDFRVYLAAELVELTKKLRAADNTAAAAILAEQILNPEDGRPVLTGAEIEALPNPDAVELLNAFFRVNYGESEKN